MGFNPFSRRQRGQQQPASNQSPVPHPVPNNTPGNNVASNGNAASNAPHRVDPNEINLVLYTPEQLMQQVQETMSGVELGMPWSIKFKWIVGEAWSVLGPICLFLGTAGEVFFFIWNNTENKGAWWVALSVLITVCVLEFTFMVVSYQSDTIRNHMKTKPGGATPEDKKDLLYHKVFWFILAAGVAIGQVSFLVVAMQGKLNNLPFLIAFSVGRSVFTLAGDFYSAFIHREMPSSGDQAEAKIKEESELTSKLLARKSEQVDLINDGVLQLKRKHTEAQITSESLETELEMKRLENRSRIDSKKILDDQARMFTELSGSIVRALFDPNMEESKRQKLLGTMQGFMGAAQMLPSGHTTVEEEKGL